MAKITTKYHTYLIYILLAVVTFIAFEPVIHNELINFDDDDYIFDNSHITGGLKPENIIWVFTNIHANNYHPVTSLSHMLDCELYGTNPAGHHFSNLLFHIANTLLLFFVFSGMTKEVWASAFVAALFALHPLHVESVAWASERKDTLSAFFWMLMMLAYMRYVKRPAVGRYLLILILFVLGLLSKPMLVTLPFVLLLLDYWPLGRLRDNQLGRLVLEKIPLFILSAILIVVTFMVQQETGLVKSTFYCPLSWRIGNALVSYTIYIGKMFWPVKLAIFYPHPRGNIPPWQITGALLILTLITFLVLWKLRRRPYIAVGWLWFLGTLVPVIGIVQVGPQGWADRYTYIPYIGLFIMIVWSVSDLFGRLRYRKVILSVSAGILLSSLAVKTHIQTSYWHNDIQLYTHAARAVKNNWWAHYRLGETYALQKEFDEAVRHFERALEIGPKDAIVYHTLAKTLLDKGDVNEAVELYWKILPQLANFNNHTSENQRLLLKKAYIDANINLAKGLVWQAHRGNPVEADSLFEQAYAKYQEVVKIKPDIGKVWNSWGNALSEHAKKKEGVEADSLFEQAYAKYQEAVKITPDMWDAWNNWGVVLLSHAQKKNGQSKEELLQEAKKKFLMAEQIKKGSGAYNLACVSAVEGYEKECKKWLKIGEEAEMLETREFAMKDEDLKIYRDKDWFKAIKWKGEK